MHAFLAWPLQFFRVRMVAPIALLLAGIAIGGLVTWRVSHKPVATLDMVPGGSIAARPGPWGDLYYTPFIIAAPDEVLEIRKMEETGTHWFFEHFNHEALAKFLLSAGLTDTQRNALMDPAVLHDEPGGLDLTPPFDVLLSLSPESRFKIYQCLAQFRRNDNEIAFLNKSTLQDRFAGSGVSQENLDLFKKLGCDYGDYLVVSGLASMLPRMKTYEEKLHFIKALTRQRTMLFRLCVTPKTDVEALARYWGRGSFATDVRTMLESVSRIKGGSWIDILMVLPPGPSSELYFYPVVQDNPLNGTPVIKDCHWTSFNFFNDIPDPKLGNPEYSAQILKTHYYPAPGDPRYGDLVLFLKPDGSAIHSAIYLADDIVFTKNGSTAYYPWMLSRISDLMKQYSFLVPPGQKLAVCYFRNQSI